MTANDFRKIIEDRYVASTYDVDSHELLTLIIPAITQCLINQEAILKKLNQK